MPRSGSLGPMTVILTEGKPKSTAERVLRWVWNFSLICLAITVLILAWLVSAGRLYESGSTLGYNLGLAGGIMILSMFLYPLRKRVRAFERFGSMVLWFRIHMVVGITGPLLILFHSTFQTASMNGRIAFYSMLFVVASGIVGRFAYRHLYRELDGHHLTVEETRAELGASTEHLSSVASLKGGFEKRLKVFLEEAFVPARSPIHEVTRFVTLRWRSRRLSRVIRHDAKVLLQRLGREKKLSRQQMARRYDLLKGRVDRHLDAIVRASQLILWERLFSFWNIVHLPFLYLLAISGIVHVVAVHMY